MAKKMNILLLAAIMGGGVVSSVLAMRRNVASAASLAARQMVPRAMDALPRVSKQVVPVAATRFNSGIVNPECRWQTPSTRSRSHALKKLSSPSLQQRWHSTPARTFSSEANWVQKAVDAHNAGDDHAYAIAIASIQGMGRPDLLQEVYALTGDSRAERDVTIAVPDNVRLATLNTQEKIEWSLEKAKETVIKSVMQSVRVNVSTKPGFSSNKSQKRMYRDPSYLAQHVKIKIDSSDAAAFRVAIKELVQMLNTDGMSAAQTFALLDDENILNFDRLKQLIQIKVEHEVKAFLIRNEVVSDIDRAVIDPQLEATRIAGQTVERMNAEIIKESIEIYNDSIRNFNETMGKLKERYARLDHSKERLKSEYRVAESQETLENQSRTHAAARLQHGELGSQKRSMSTARSFDESEHSNSQVVNAIFAYSHNPSAYRNTIKRLKDSKQIGSLRSIANATGDVELAEYLEEHYPQESSKKTGRYSKESMTEYYHNTAGDDYDYGDQEYAAAVTREREKSITNADHEGPRTTDTSKIRIKDEKLTEAAPETQPFSADKKSASLEKFNTAFNKSIAEFKLLNFTPSDTNDRFPRATWWETLTGYGSYYERVARFVASELERSAKEGTLFDLPDMQARIEFECKEAIKSLEKGGLNYSNAARLLKESINWKKMGEDCIPLLQKKLEEYIASHRLSYNSMNADLIATRTIDTLLKSGAAAMVIEKYQEKILQILDIVLGQLREEDRHFQMFKNMGPEIPKSDMPRKSRQGKGVGW